MARLIHRAVSVCDLPGYGFPVEARALAVAGNGVALCSGDDASRESFAPRRGDHQLALPRCMMLALMACAALSLARAHAETPAAVCSRLGDDDAMRPISASLVPAVNALFGTRMSSAQAVDTTMFRCANGHVLVCTTGANLSCGPANTSRVPGPGAVDWCRDHPGAAFIPAVATGHDTIFAWECRNGAPRVTRQVHAVDARGFISDYWKELPE